MSKFSIEVHEWWVRKNKDTLRRRKQEIRLREKQIEEAKKLGKDGFDSERFLVKREKK